MNSRRLMGAYPKAKGHRLIIAQCIAARSGYSSPSWVRSVESVAIATIPLYPPGADIGADILEPLLSADFVAKVVDGFREQ
jgi:hypothetical protein